MKKYSEIVVLFLLTGLFLLSCTKEDGLGKPTYYGTLQGELKDLPGTPSLGVYLNDKKITTLSPGGNFGIGGTQHIVAGQLFNMQLRSENDNEVLADTSFTVEQDQPISFSFAWSEEMNIKGFLQSNPVSPDTLSIQFANALSDINNPAAGIDLYVVKVDLYTFEVMDTVAVFPDFKKGKLTPALILPADDMNNPSFIYGGMLKDRKTGVFIADQSGWPFFIVLFDWFYYASRPVPLIGVISDSGGIFSTNLVEL